MRRRPPSLIQVTFLLSALAVCRAGQADIIHLVDTSGSHSRTTFAQPFNFGQSFTADPSVANLGSIGFQWQDVNSGLAFPTLEMELFEGDGYSGAELGSVVQTLVSLPPDDSFLEFDFLGQGISLADSQVYTFRVTNTTPGRGSYVFQNVDAFAGGQAYALGSPQSGEDIGFQLVGSAAVPEPSSLLAMSSALVCLLGFRWRGRKQQVHDRLVEDTN